MLVLKVLNLLCHRIVCETRDVNAHRISWRVAMPADRAGHVMAAVVGN